jgi:hypothetical protein
MDFKEFYSSLSVKEREKYAQDADTSCEYIRIHLVTKKKIPRPELMQKLADASKGKLTLSDILEFFYTKQAA